MESFMSHFVFLRVVAVVLLGTQVSCASQSAPRNVLFINVDDMNCDSVGVYGCKTPNITPHMDRLASQGMRFEHAHVTVAICQPTRAVWLTGQWPHHSGALGFDKIKPGVPTMPEALRKAGYLTGCFAKTGHMIPSRHSEAFEVSVPAKKLKNGRGVREYYEHTKSFLDRAKESKRPFFLAACIQDPHRPFAGSAQETARRKNDHKSKADQYGGGFPEVKDAYTAKEVEVPGFLPDLQPVRKEIAEYYTSVRRADAIVGSILRALEESGQADNTVVIFMSDHGMPLPFAKTNCWRHSTRTPWMVRWPGTVKTGTVDSDHVIGGIDFTPTVLDIAGVERLDGQDGRSIVPILKGQTQAGRDFTHTYINTIASKKSYAMRAINGKRYGYIWNGWSDGRMVFKNESQSGLTFKAMKTAAENDPQITARVDLFVHRVPEEMYDYAADPDALRNLAAVPEFEAEVAALRLRMLEHMRETDDPQTAAFEKYLAGLGK